VRNNTPVMIDDFALAATIWEWARASTCRRRHAVKLGTKYVMRTDVMYGPVGQTRG